MTNFEPEADSNQDQIPIAYSSPNPGLVELTPAGLSPLAEAEDREQRRWWNRTRAVRAICTIINVVGGVFAVVLPAQIIMVLGEANPANGVASFVRGFAAAVVSLGFDNLFTPANAKLGVLSNDGPRRTRVAGSRRGRDHADPPLRPARPTPTTAPAAGSTPPAQVHRSQLAALYATRRCGTLCASRNCDDGSVLRQEDTLAYGLVSGYELITSRWV
jgi:hypothetical protein